MSAASNQTSFNHKLPQSYSMENLDENSKTVMYQDAELNELCDYLISSIVRRDRIRDSLARRSRIQDSSERKVDDWFKTYKERQEKITRDFEESKAKWKSPVRIMLEGMYEGVNLGFMIIIAMGLVKKIASSAFVTNLIQKNLLRV